MENPELSRRNRIYLLATAGLVVLALIIYFVFLNKATITLEIVPKNAVFTLNNAPQPVNNSGIAKINVKPGDYTLRVEANKFVPYQQKLTLKTGSRFSQKVSLKSIPGPILLQDGTTLVQKYGDNQISYLGNENKTLYTVSAVADSSGATTLGSKKAITPPVFSGVDRVAYSPDRALAIIKIGSDAYLYDFNRYDILHQDMKKIGTDIGEVVWAPDQNRIAYYYAPASGERSLIFADPLNQNPQRVLSLANINNPSLNWSKDGSTILMVPHNSQPDDNKVYVFDVYLKQLKNVTDFGGVISVKYTEDGKHIVYFVADDGAKNPAAWVMDASGENKRSLEIGVDPNQSFVEDKGNIIFVTTINDQQRIMLYDLNTSGIKEIYFTPPKETVYKGLFLSSDHKIVYLATNTGLYAVRYEDSEY